MSKNMRLKREIAKVLSVALVGSMAVMPVMAKDYADQKDYANHWAKEAIEKWSNKGIINGFEDGNFKPKNNLTRGELAAFIVRVFGLKDTNGAKAYGDVHEAKWYAADIAKVSAAGLMNDEAESFRPDEHATREEAVYALASAYKMTGKSETSFNDEEEISKWAKPMVQAMAANGHINGRPDGSFAPQDALTRADLITMLDKITAELIGEKGTYTQDVAGNLVINTEDVVLENMEISGNLYLAKGIGQGKVELRDVKIEGTAYVEAGEITFTGDYMSLNVQADAKVTLQGATVEKITVEKNEHNKAAALYIDKSSKVQQLIANGSVNTTGDGKIEELVATTNEVNVEKPSQSTSNNVSSSNGNASDDDDDTTVSVTNVSLNLTQVNLKAEETVELTATVRPTDATLKSVKWTSDNEAVATVDDKGKVTAVAPGVAVITATTVDGQFTATCKINVGMEAAAVTEGATYSMTTEEVTPEGVKVALPFKSQEGVLSVAYTEVEAVEGFALEGENVSVTNAVQDGASYTVGYIVAAGQRTIAGQVVITATNEIVEVESVSLNQEALLLKAGETASLRADINPTNATNQDVTWASSDENVVTVDETGEVTAIAPGEATITVTTAEGNFTASCKVKVGVSLESATEGATYAVTTEEVTPAGLHVELPFKSQEGVLSVTYTEVEAVEGFALEGENVSVTNAVQDGASYTVGYIVAADQRTIAGQVIITATNEIVEVESVSLNQEALLLKAGETASLRADINPTNATNQAVTWASSDENVVTVDETGKVTAIAPGEATITVTTAEGNFTADCKVKVGVSLGSATEGATYAVTTEEVTPAGLHVELPFKNQEGILSVAYTEVEAVEGFALEGEKVSVTNAVQDGAVYTVGYIVAADQRTIAGQVVITATNQIVEVESVSLAQEELVLKAGETVSLVAAINPTNATNQAVTWVSSDESVAKVDEEGNVVALGEGTATLTVRTEEGNYTAACTVTVEKEADNEEDEDDKEETVVPVEGVVLNHTEITIKKKETLQLIATVYPSGATNQNVKWHAINPENGKPTNKLTIDEMTGLITPKSTGNALVIVTTEDGAYTAQCIVNIKS